MTRESILQSYREKIAGGHPILGAGAGCGLSATAAEQGGADFISIYTTAMYRMEGLPTILAWLPYGNVNDEMRALSRKILPLIHSTPCIAGLGAHDPRLDLRALAEEFAGLGYAGINNEPFANMYGGLFYELLNRSGLGLEREAALMQAARGSGLIAMAWAASETDAVTLAQAGADIIGVLFPIDETGEDPAEYWARCLETGRNTVAAAKRDSADVITVIHGGPLATPERIQEGLYRTGADGYAGGSNLEKAPAVKGIRDAVHELSDLRLRETTNG